MSVTRLKRKHRKNIARANNKQHIIKELLRTPVLKNVDIEELKSRFTTTSGVAGAVETVKQTASKAADKVKEVVADAVEAVKEAVAPATAETATPEAATTDETAANAEAFDDAEAVTKPVNEDGQEGEHPKPEIAL
ncbi:MAG TPA: hypothetical protein VF629_05595 [Hymenobacter sp.]|uniref:hypothetical protein n=1 Tax=Hymenobacter sp. TaxID=1898978 RepID=UPI002EDBB715